MDIARIEEHMSTGMYSKKKGAALIDKVHKQTKDDNLEDGRKRMIKGQRQRDKDHRRARENPESLNDQEFKYLLKHFHANPERF